MAPEVIAGKYGKQCDMWSIGVITYIMLTGVPPFNAKDDAEILGKVSVGQYSTLTLEECGVSDDAIDFIGKLLQKNPKKRMSAESALQHQWITKYRVRSKMMMQGIDTMKNNMLDPAERENEGIKKLQEATILILVNLLDPDILKHYK